MISRRAFFCLAILSMCGEFFSNFLLHLSEYWMFCDFFVVPFHVLVSIYNFSWFLRWLFSTQFFYLSIHMHIWCFFSALPLFPLIASTMCVCCCFIHNDLLFVYVLNIPYNSLVHMGTLSQTFFFPKPSQYAPISIFLRCKTSNNKFIWKIDREGGLKATGKKVDVEEGILLGQRGHQQQLHTTTTTAKTSKMLKFSVRLSECACRMSE